MTGSLRPNKNCRRIKYKFSLFWARTGSESQTETEWAPSTYFNGTKRSSFLPNWAIEGESRQQQPHFHLSWFRTEPRQQDQEGRMQICSKKGEEMNKIYPVAVRDECHSNKGINGGLRTGWGEEVQVSKKWRNYFYLLTVARTSPVWKHLPPLRTITPQLDGEAPLCHIDDAALVSFCLALPLRPFLTTSTVLTGKAGRVFRALGVSLLSQTSSKSQHAVALLTKRNACVWAWARTHTHRHTL